VLRMPRRAVADRDPVLADVYRVEDEVSCVDDLCVLYVAMTRAKRALYIVTSYPGAGSSSVSHGAFVKEQLAGSSKALSEETLDIAGVPAMRLYEQGRRDWYRAPSATGKTAPPAALRELPPDFNSLPASREPLVAVEPSAHEPFSQRASHLFNREARDVLDFGSAIHGLYEQIEWMEEADPDRIAAEWRSTATVSPVVADDVCRQFLQSVQSGEVRAALARPAGDVILWREKRFEVILDENHWVSGAFDRVTIRRDREGRPAGAVILDYKSNRVETEAEVARTARRYEGQLSLYRRALARILDIQTETIELSLLFTRPGRVVTLP